MTEVDRGVDTILGLLAGKWISQAISTAASLGVADALLAGPLAIDELAGRLACDRSMLERLMRVLVGEGLFELSDDDLYHVTATGRLLAEGDHHHLKELAMFMGCPAQWAPWAFLSKGIRKGASAYEMTHGRSLYAWLDTHPEDARLYDEGVDRFTSEVARRAAEAFDFSSVRRVVDVGGGLGTLLAEVLERWPKVEGVLVDRPNVLSRARAKLDGRGLLARCELIAGDFFDPLPAGADVYLVKHVLHNWGDEDAVRILSRCREAVAPSGAVLVVEGMIHPGSGRNMPRLMDLEMMVLFGKGKERTKREFQVLFRAAGLSLERGTRPLDRFARLLVGRRTDRSQAEIPES